MTPSPARRPTTTTRWLPAVLLPVVVLSLALAVRGGTGTLADGLARGLGWGLVLVAGLGVVLLAAGAPRRAEWLPSLSVAALLVVLTAVSQSLPPLWPAGELGWQGKVLDLVWLTALFLVLPRWARDEAGIRLALRPGAAVTAWSVVLGVLLAFVALTVVSVAAGWIPAEPVTPERLLYDTTIPNLTEELLWRGALLAVLDRLCGTPRTVLGAELGWGVVVSAVVFGLGHGVVLGEDWSWSLRLGGGVFAGVMGLALGWIRARTGSVWPAFLLHCAPEVGVDLGLIAMG